VTPEVLQQTERGLRRILQALGMLPDHAADAARGTRALNALGSVYANWSGVFEPLKTIGEAVAEGEAVGLIHHPDTPGQAPDAVISPYDGLVLAMRAMAQLRRGDALFQIAADVV
jgi:predicted deacylase